MSSMSIRRAAVQTIQPRSVGYFGPRPVRSIDRPIERASRELGRVFRQVAPAADDRAADLLAGRVRAVDPAATDEEIAHFLQVKAWQAVDSRKINNLVGFLIWSVPQCFGGAMIEDYRDTVRQERAERRAKLEDVLADPECGPELRQMAEQELARIGA